MKKSKSGQPPHGWELCAECPDQPGGTLSDAAAAAVLSIRRDVRSPSPSLKLPSFAQRTSYPALSVGAFWTEIQKDMAPPQCKARLQELHMAKAQ